MSAADIPPLTLRNVPLIRYRKRSRLSTGKPGTEDGARVDRKLPDLLGSQEVPRAGKARGHAKDAMHY